MASRCAKTTFPILIFLSNLQYLVSGKDFAFFTPFLLPVWVHPSSREVKLAMILFHGNQLCPPLPLSRFPGSKSWDKDGTGCSTKHERKIPGVWVAGSLWVLFWLVLHSAWIHQAGGTQVLYNLLIFTSLFWRTKQASSHGSNYCKDPFGLFVFDPKQFSRWETEI